MRLGLLVLIFVVQNTRLANNLLCKRAVCVYLSMKDGLCLLAGCTIFIRLLSLGVCA